MLIVLGESKEVGWGRGEQVLASECNLFDDVIVGERRAMPQPAGLRTVAAHPGRLPRGEKETSPNDQCP